MTQFLARVRTVPANVRWGSLLAVVLIAVLGVWFFFLRQGSGPIPPAPPQRPALGKVVPLADYRATIQSAQNDLNNALSSEGDTRKEAIKRVKADLQVVEGASITGTEGGATLAQVDNTRLLQELAEDDPNLEAVSSGLALLASSLQVGPAGHVGAVDGTMSGADAEAALASVLSNPIYDYARSESPLAQLARWLASLTGESDPDSVLSRLFLSLLAGIAVAAIIFLSTDKWVPNRWARLGLSALGGLLAAGIFYLATEHFDVVFQALTAVGLAVAAVAVGLILAGLNRGSAPGSVRSVSDLASVLGMSAQEARVRADQSASEGDYHSAIRYRCLAVLLALDEAGMLVFDRSATNREYLFRAPGPLHDQLQLLLSRFEEVWYGNSPTSAEEWTQYTARAASIEAQITTKSQPKAA